MSTCNCRNPNGECSCSERLGVENYDANSNVCANQNDYNQAFYNAIKYNNKKVMDKNRGWLIAYSVMYLLFLIWAVFIAIRYTYPGPERTLHLVFAILASPIYVLAFYIGILGKR